VSALVLFELILITFVYIFGFIVVAFFNDLADALLSWRVGFPLAFGSVTLVVLLMLYGQVVELRDRLRGSRTELLQDTYSTTMTGTEQAASQTVARLAQQVDTPSPDLLIRSTAGFHCYTVPSEDGPVLVVSTGLLTVFSPEAIEAFLAHEIAHLANRDHRVMALVLVPLMLVEQGQNKEEETWWIINMLVANAAVAAGVFSRGRELAADTAAARLTGDPAALASALNRLDDSTDATPSEDLRKHTKSADALSVYPTLDPSTDNGGGLTATHPSTEKRVKRLERLAKKLEAE